MAKHIPINDRPIIRIEGILEDIKSVKLNANNLHEIKVRKGKTIYSIIVDHKSILATIPPIGSSGIYDTIEVDYISYVYKAVEAKKFSNEMNIAKVEYMPNKIPPRVFKKVSTKTTKLKLVGRNINAADL
jgi:hypothetical protein